MLPALTHPSPLLFLLLLTFSPLTAKAQQLSSNVTDIPSAILGTWSTGTGAVRTGPGFCNPVTSTFTVPAATGFSYSFTADGYFEEAIYTISTNATYPGCLTTALIWQHGKFSVDSSNNINLLPEPADGRINVTNPCEAPLAVQYYYQTEKFAGFATSINSSGTPILTLNRFDGAPLQPMFLISRTPIILGTGIISSGIPSSQVVSPTGTSAAGRSRAEWGMILGICVGAVMVAVI
ncbi:hypothetical protein BC937DRAFT_95506 [Endogone sp. FLAS-F59071]|nr:hypothetical protein BC937DRAFT_95506 [Endogone sp. FLAS-F59071]|eukprot:RUS20307.1 hypothetical protein BC937DRAFT_95506 [Endogone sp. FLAS-F59071]